MVFRAVRVYLFLLLCNITFGVLFSLLEFYPSSLTMVTKDAPFGSFFENPLTMKLVLIGCISSAIASIFGTFSWIWLGKLHPLFCVGSLIVIFFLVRFSLPHNNDPELMIGVLFYFAILSSEVLSVTWWLAKQIYDAKDRNIRIEITALEYKSHSIWLVGSYIFIFFILIYLMSIFVPRMVLSVFIENAFNGVINTLFNPSSLVAVLAPGVIMAIYTAWKLYRKTYLLMVKFTRFGILTSLIVVGFTTLIILLRIPLPTSSYMNQLAVTLLPTILATVCQTAVCLSLSFWFALKCNHLGKR